MYLYTCKSVYTYTYIFMYIDFCVRIYVHACACMDLVKKGSNIENDYL